MKQQAIASAFIVRTMLFRRLSKPAVHFAAVNRAKTYGCKPETGILPETAADLQLILAHDVRG